MYKRLLLIFALATTFTIYSCSDDNEMDEMMDMDQDNLTTQMVGSYKGTNEFGEGGSFITEENRTATVTMVSNSVVNFTVFTGFGDNPTFEGVMSIETEFTTSDVTILGDGAYAGTGKLSGDSIYIDISSGNKYYEFAGLRE